MRRAALKNDRDRAERDDVVDDGRLAEQSLDRRQGRAVAHLGPLAFEAFDYFQFIWEDEKPEKEPKDDTETSIDKEVAD